VVVTVVVTVVLATLIIPITHHLWEIFRECIVELLACVFEAASSVIDLICQNRLVMVEKRSIVWVGCWFLCYFKKDTEEKTH
jgi:hypothetical protein